MSVMENENNTANASANVNPKGLKGEIAFEHTLGKVRGTVWKNFSQKTGKHYYKISVRRIEFDGDGKSYLANSYWPEDLKDSTAVNAACRIWLQDNTDAYEQQREWRKEKMKRSKKPKASRTESPESNE
jgi:hypothetical protein